MKLSLLLIPAAVSTLFITGCATGPGTYEASDWSNDNSSAWEADARMDDWLNEQQAQQDTAEAAQAAVDGANAAAAASVAAAAANQ